MKLKILSKSDIPLDTPLPWAVYDQTGTLLLSKFKIINSELQLDTLVSYGPHIDEDALQDDSKSVLFSQPLVAMKPVGLLQQWSHMATLLQNLLTQPERNPSFLAQVDIVAAHLVKLHDIHADFSIYRVVRQENYLASNYGYAHAMHTAVLCVLLSRHLGWPQDRMMSLVKAALTMNMTIVKLQGAMAAQTWPVEEPQRIEIFGHPAKTVALLKVLGVTDVDWLTAIEQHHEQPGGAGYPTGQLQVSEMARLLRVVDVFTAKISPRVFRLALSPQDAIRKLYLDDQGGALSLALINTLGIYPPGDFVTLASGELGLVVERTGSAKAPVVAAITDSAGTPGSRTVRRDTRQAEFAITGKVSDKTMLQRLLPERLYGFAIINPLDLAPLELLIG